MPQFNICLDAGHGGHDPGATGNGLLEKDLNLYICNKVFEKLKQHDELFVFRTRGSDKWLSLRMRCGIANENNADLFVSFHVNAAGGTGFESFICPGAERAAIAQRIIHNEVYRFMKNYDILESFPLTIGKEDWQVLKNFDPNAAVAADVNDRGHKLAHFYVLVHTRMPAVLFETLFIDSSDAELLKDKQFLDGVAQNYAEGILKYFGLMATDEPGELRDRIEQLEIDLEKARDENQIIQTKLDQARNDLSFIVQRANKWVKEELIY